MEQLILVDENDVFSGTMEKMEVHEKAMLHRAFSVFIFNLKGEMLLQQRASDKYHSGGLWTNSCCSHPRPGEDTIAAASRRLKEEMGFTTPLKKVFDFVYKASFENGLTEHEFDHVYVGYYSDVIRPNQKEVKGYAYYTLEKIAHLLQTHPEMFTAWFHIAFPKVMEWWKNHPQDSI
ncbi:MAG: isopentenyl-diphosphate Delta-isomerase [Sediminibacterium sp.]